MATRRILQVISWLALAATIVPPVLFLAERMDLAQAKNWMLAATILWFAATPFWMGRERPAAA